MLLALDALSLCQGYREQCTNHVDDIVGEVSLGRNVPDESADPPRPMF